jgi:hypothetical protein
VTCNDWRPPEGVERDVVVCAGDVKQPATHALRWLRGVFPDNRIVYVLGNHERYSDGSPKAAPGMKTTWAGELAAARALAPTLGIDLLENDSVVIDGPDGESVRFLGCTLWTDFAHRPEYMSLREAIRMAESGRGMNDFRNIKVGEGSSRDKLRAVETIAAHRTSVAFLERALAEKFGGETVVVTHHVPVIDGPPSELDWCYRSGLERLMHGDRAPQVWIHGHVHKCVDQAVGSTRVVANPRGYPKFPLPRAPRENPEFDEIKIVEVGQPKPVSTYGWR